MHFPLVSNLDTREMKDFIGRHLRNTDDDENTEILRILDEEIRDGTQMSKLRIPTSLVFHHRDLRTIQNGGVRIKFTVNKTTINPLQDEFTATIVKSHHGEVRLPRKTASILRILLTPEHRSEDDESVYIPMR